MVEPWVEPDTAALLRRMATDFGGGPAEPTIEQRRENLERAAMLYGPDPVSVRDRQEQRIGGPAGDLIVHVYWPETRDTNLPVLLHIHGGGWALGGPTAYERVARNYCIAGSCVVIDVDYRRAPEHKHPAALEDCMAALEWAYSHAVALGGDPQRIVIAGDSAGGHLAALIAQRTDVPLAGQILVYPVCAARSNGDTASRHLLGDGRYFLAESDICRAEREYFPDLSENEAVANSPMLASASILESMPSTLIVTASLDPLVDEGARYAERLAATGIDIQYECVEGTIHGFILFAGHITLGQKQIRKIGRWIRDR